MDNPSPKLELELDVVKLGKSIGAVGEPSEAMASGVISALAMLELLLPVLIRWLRDLPCRTSTLLLLCPLLLVLVLRRDRGAIPAFTLEGDIISVGDCITSEKGLSPPRLL